MAARPRLLHAFATFQAAGPQVRTVALMDAFGADFEHAIVALDGQDQAFGRIGAHVPARLVEPPPRAGSLATVRRLRGLLARERPDLVLTYNWGAIDAVVAARTLGLSIVHHEDGFRPDEVQGLKLRRNLFRRVVLGGGVRTVVVPSEVLGRVARDAWRLPRTRVIPNGIHCERFVGREADGARVRAELGVPGDAFLVGSVGHLRPEKNPTRLLEAFGALSGRAHLVFVGDGPERPALEARARGLGVARRVHLVGHQEDPGAFLAALSAFALPSDTEQMPVALLEAMATALPAAATDVGDVRVILPEVQAASIVPRDAEALGRALAALEADPERARALGRANRARVLERYSFDVMKNAHRDVWERAL